MILGKTNDLDSNVQRGNPDKYHDKKEIVVKKFQLILAEWQVDGGVVTRPWVRREWSLEHGEWASGSALLPHSWILKHRGVRPGAKERAHRHGVHRIQLLLLLSTYPTPCFMHMHTHAQSPEVKH